MTKYIKSSSLIILSILFASATIAKENVGSSGKKAVSYKQLAVNCNPASAQIDLNINNVRTTLLNGGDIWWDLSGAKYEIPKVDPSTGAPSVHSLFAGAIWLGGIDAGGQLKIAAQTYRQTGNDFWPGPLDDNAATNESVCSEYDRFWSVLGEDIDRLIAYVEANGTPVPLSEISPGIQQWPALGNEDAPSARGNTLNITGDLAPFHDYDGNGEYDPTKGDYPIINPDCEEALTYADQMIFWVYNDKGNIHTETGGQAIGIQVNALAFAFKTSDEVNDMTFYRYKLINKATIPIRNFYMAQWVDADLGCYVNDYVGCDTTRALGICYNGTAVDADCASRGYGNDPPLVGVDFFEGPLSDPIMDPIDSTFSRKKLGMSAFTYYNNDGSVQGNPESAVHFYNYMTGFWKDNTPFTSDVCNAKGGSISTKYMFPSDPACTSPFPTCWSECSCNNPPADRRFLQSAGPFTLNPGDVNNITVGVVWVRPSGVYPCPSFESTIGLASDKAQALFDNCFKLVDGPDAPTLVIRELDKELIISLTNLPGSNNVNESYEELDPIASALARATTITPRVIYTPQPADTSCKLDSCTFQVIFDIDTLSSCQTAAIDCDTIFHRDLLPYCDNLAIVCDPIVTTTTDTLTFCDPAADQCYPSDSLFVNVFVEVNFLNTYGDTQFINTFVADTVFTNYLARTEFDTTLSNPEITDTTYEFQGYKIYQLRNAQVSVQELNDATKARLLTQVDIKDDIARVTNYIFDPIVGASIPTLMVDGANAGIKKSIRVTSDLFATGSSSLINHKTYYYTAIAYAYNNYAPFDISTGEGQAAPYLQGRRNYRIYSAIPHIPDPGRGGTDLLTEYGDGVKVTRLDGKGNGGLNLELTQESVDGILNSPDHFLPEIEYEPRMGPIDVQVYDPMKIKEADFQVVFVDTTNGVESCVRNVCNNLIVSPSAYWYVTVFNMEDNLPDTIFSSRDIESANEQLLSNYGLSITINQVSLAGKGPDAPNGLENIIPANGFIEGTIEYKDPEVRWLGGVQDQGTFDERNWIRSGQYTGGDEDEMQNFFDDHRWKNLVDPKGGDVFYDPDEVFESVLTGTWAPYSLATNWVNKALTEDPVKWRHSYSYGPAFLVKFRRSLSLNTVFDIPYNTLHNLHGVDVVFTPDKSKWTRVVVLELGEDSTLTQGNAIKGQIRMAPSWDKSGFYHGTNLLPQDTGRSWFPGYAINVETGERLNMMFGEDSWLIGENGRDMIWNPTANELSPIQSAEPLFGGKHYIYVLNTRYDEGAAMQRAMLDTFNMFKPLGGGGGALQQFYNPLNDKVYQHIMWVSMAELVSGFQLLSPEQGIVPNETKVRLRVNVPYARFMATGLNNTLPYYSFSTRGLGTATQQLDVAKTACDLIRVVPNPYYAYSAYETSQLDNRVKVTNLPDNCTVTIYTLGGTKIREFKRAVTGDISEGAPTDVPNPDSSIDWDLKNHKNIPVASGIYLIHIKADGVCERVVKWFGVMRPIDLDTF